MRYLLMLIAFAAIVSTADAQTTGGTATGQNKTPVSKPEKKRIQRGTGQYYGNKDTTPGSPVGTGGAGGDMSGSPAASAIATDDEATKADVNKDTSARAGGTTNATSKGSTIKKTRSTTTPKNRNY